MNVHRPARYVLTPWFVVMWVSFGLTAEQPDREAIEQEQQSGPVDVRLTLTPKDPVIGDTVTLTIEVTAKEGVEILMPEFGDALDRFSIVDFAPRQSIDDQGDTVATQTYRLDPPSSGKHVIPPILVEYVDRREGKQQAPDGLDAYEVLTDRIPFEVSSVLPDDASLDLKPPMGQLEPIAESEPARWPWLVVVVVCVLAVAAPFLVRWFSQHRRRRRRRSAYELAQSRLERILSKPRATSEEIDAFYVGLSGIIRQYIEDRFEMRAPELTTEEFLASIGQSPDFSTDHQGLLREFLRQADLVKFARAVPSTVEIDNAIDKAKRFLEETREDAFMVDERVDSAGDSDTDPNPARDEASSSGVGTEEVRSG